MTFLCVAEEFIDNNAAGWTVFRVRLVTDRILQGAHDAPFARSICCRGGGRTREKSAVNRQLCPGHVGRLV